MFFRLFALVLLVLLGALLASWLGAQPGMMQLEWLGWQIEMRTSLAVAIIAIAALALLMLLFVHYRDLVFLGVDPEGAVAARRPVTQIRFLAIVITALVVISAITAVGIVLVIGLLCAPVLVHVERSRSLSDLMLRSAGTGLLLCGGGMMLAVAGDLPPGPLIGVLCVTLLLIRR